MRILSPAGFLLAAAGPICASVRPAVFQDRLPLPTLIFGAVAGDPLPEALPLQDGPRWNIAVRPYLWAAGLDGETGIDPVPAASVDASFSDITDHLEGGAMVDVDVRRGESDWAWLLDLQALRLGDDSSSFDVDVEQVVA